MNACDSCSQKKRTLWVRTLKGNSSRCLQSDLADVAVLKTPSVSWKISSSRLFKQFSLLTVKCPVDLSFNFFVYCKIVIYFQRRRIRYIPVALFESLGKLKRYSVVVTVFRIWPTNRTWTNWKRSIRRCRRTSCLRIVWRGILWSHCALDGNRFWLP